MANNDQSIDFKHEIVTTSGPGDPHIKAVGDVDGDGLTDIIAASSNGGPIVWYRYPDWQEHVIAPEGKWSCDAKLADMNSNGRLDLVISEWYGLDRMEWYENPGPGGGLWKRHAIGPGRAHNIELGDLAGDGQSEIVTRSQGDAGDHIVIWKRNGETDWVSRQIPCPVGEGLALCDLTGNGRLDILISGRWYEAPGDIMRDDWVEHVFADWPCDAVVQTAFIGGSGRPDVVMARSEGPHRLSWFEAPDDPADGLWQEHVIDDSVDFAHSLAVADINGNGKVDIMIAEMHQSERKRVLVYMNAGAGASWTRHVLAETGSHNVCLADIGATGTLDLVGANWSGDYQPIEIWRQIAR